MHFLTPNTIIVVLTAVVMEL
jgi:hypothetical protein